MGLSCQIFGLIDNRYRHHAFFSGRLLVANKREASYAAQKSPSNCEARSDRFPLTPTFLKHYFFGLPFSAFAALKTANVNIPNVEEGSGTEVILLLPSRTILEALTEIGTELEGSRVILPLASGIATRIEVSIVILPPSPGVRMLWPLSGLINSSPDVTSQ